MLFLINGCTFSACRYYGSLINRAKLLQFRWSPNLNLKNKISCRLFSAERNPFVSNVNVKKYLDRLMNAYQNEVENEENILEILKIRAIHPLLNEKIKIMENLKGLNDLVSENEDMKSLVKEEESIYKEQLTQIDGQILDMIMQNLGVEAYDNVILEIMPGVGGQESMLFCRDILNMYTSYLEYLGFTYEVTELGLTETGGIRKAALLISDSKAFDKLRYESGVHRVQRIPTTEKSGRLHTSTVAVTVFPEPRDVDVRIEEKDLRIESMRASGAGGQHVNTTNSAIRVTHVPTGKVVTCQTNRSQLKNRQLAVIKLKSILYQEQVDKQVSFISELCRKQMGSRLRNEKIRTYNFNQDRVTDHRLANGTMHNLKVFMRDGAALEELENRLFRDIQQKTFLEIIEKMDNQLKSGE